MQLMAFIAGIDLLLARRACSYANVASSRFPMSSARLPGTSIRLVNAPQKRRSYQSGATPPHSSLPSAAKPAPLATVAAVGVPSRAVEGLQEDHGVIACQEAMDDEPP